MSTARREGIATLFWLLLIAAVVFGLWWYWQRQPGPEAAPVTGPPAGTQEVSVRFPQDGDSLEVAALAPGPVLPGVEPVQIRLLGIDAPETHGADGLPQCWAETAKAELLKLAPSGGRLWLQRDEQAQDVYGRYLVYAWTPDGAFVNERLAQLGAVYELAIPPNFGHQDRLAAAVVQARGARTGLWGACAN
jgi:endonuclease YncB( thermonuclease family)